MKSANITTLPTIPADAFSSADGCWTIDSTSGAGDNGFLDCARAGHPGVGAHGSTTQTIDNLLGCLPAVLAVGNVKKTANIVGHGNDGIIVTGTGQNVSDTKKYVAWWNRSSWQADLQRLRGRAAIIRLWACHPGTAQEGLDLLNYVCQETGAISMGPTGFLNCGGGSFSLEVNSTWQVVTPGQPLPQPIAAPTPHFDVVFNEMKISDGNGYEHIVPDDITAVEILTGGGRSVLKLALGESQDFIRTVVAFDSPFTVEGIPAAILTAQIRIHFGPAAERLVGASRDFLVWNDRRLEDAIHRGHFYSASVGLRSFLRAI